MDYQTNMGPPEAVDREFVYIDLFVFCVCFGSRAFFFLPPAFFLLSSWLILPHLGSIWDHLGSILGSLGSILGHLGFPECVFGVCPSLYLGLFEGDLRKCNTYATCFSTLHFIDVKVVYNCSKIVFPFGHELSETM